jgi:predicted acyltransferase
MLTISGAAAMAIGLAWGLVFPINKPLWTSSYVLLTAGLASILLAAWIVFLPARPFVVFGVNPLLAFLGSGLMARTLAVMKVDGVSLQALSYRTFFEPYFPPHFASFLWALTFVGVWYGILWLLYRKRIFLRV